MPKYPMHGEAGGPPAARRNNSKPKSCHLYFVLNLAGGRFVNKTDNFLQAMRDLFVSQPQILGLPRFGGRHLADDPARIRSCTDIPAKGSTSLMVAIPYQCYRICVTDRNQPAGSCGRKSGEDITHPTLTKLTLLYTITRLASLSAC